MNPSSACAQVLVDELVRNGVGEAVLSPGSRSAPLAYALHEADAAGRLRLHVRIDERSAGFLALGLAKASGQPAVVVTTSGTAVVNLHPAVVEASMAGVPLIVLSADRPPELRGVGANQTIDQVRLFGGDCRDFRELGAPEHRAGQVAYWRAVVCRSVTAARGTLDADPGPVQLNVALRDPLTPTPGDWPESLDGRPAGRPWTSVAAPRRSAPVDSGEARTLLVLGQAAQSQRTAARELAAASGWPVLDELDAAVLLDTAFVRAHLPERILAVGPTTTTRELAALLRHPEVALDVVTASPRWADAGSVARRVLPALPGVASVAPGAAVADPAFAAAWSAATAAARSAVRSFADDRALGGLAVAAALSDVAPDLVFLGASSVIRNAALVGGWRRAVLANRGASGIDGSVSSAVGAALASGGRTHALLGDLTFVHDSNGLVIGPGEPRPDLCIVVVNDDGGSIFAGLEPGAPELAGPFERVFATPHGTDLAALCEASGVECTRVTDHSGLHDALAPRAGLRVVEVAVDRHDLRADLADLRRRVGRT